MKIAICTDMYLPQLGGVADSVVLQARGLRAIGHEVRIFAAHMKGEMPDPTVTRFPSMELFGGTFCLVNARGLDAAIVAYAPDVIHVHSFGTIGHAALRAARAHKIPCVGTNHGSPLDYLHYFYADFQPIRYFVARYVSRFYDQFDIVTTPTVQPMHALQKNGLRKPKTEVVSNAVDFSLFRPIADTQALRAAMGIESRGILIFGRLAKEKNLDGVLEVFERVRSRESGGALVIVGDGPYRSYMEREVKRRGLGAYTYFLGRLSGEELVSAINACDVMLTTSLSEAQPMTILQANICGVPAVGSRAGGIPECIADNVTGFLVAPNDYEDFAEKVARLLNDHGLQKSMGAAARERVAGYEPSAIARIWERLYRTLPGVL
jgi:glycosyltransferase involved in cell wall biosynthesis